MFSLSLTFQTFNTLYLFDFGGIGGFPIEFEAVQPIQSPNASSDVTLVSGDANVCKHFKYGFCKFGEKCNKQHLKEICQTEDCNLKTCSKRHPKICKFFSVNQPGSTRYASSVTLAATSTSLAHINATFWSRSPHYMRKFPS